MDIIDKQRAPKVVLPKRVRLEVRRQTRTMFKFYTDSVKRSEVIDDALKLLCSIDDAQLFLYVEIHVANMFDIHLRNTEIEQGRV